MTDLTFRPIDQWPDGWRDPDRHRVWTPFRATYSETLGELRDELHAHDALQAHAQVDVGPGQVRRDGALYARAKAEHPGVILTVVTPTRTLVMGTDRFVVQWGNQGEAWHHNLRACVLGLRDLRRMTRYGLVGAHGGDQYAGFAALPSGGPVALGAGMTPYEAATRLAAHAWPGEAADYRQDWAGRMLTDPDLYTRTYREAARRAHPDGGGSDEAMAEVNEARRVLESHHDH